MSAGKRIGIEGCFYTNGLDFKHKLQKMRLREGEIPNEVKNFKSGSTSRKPEPFVVWASIVLPLDTTISTLTPLSGTVQVLRGSVSTSTCFVKFFPNRTTPTRNPVQLATRPHRSLIREEQNYWSLRSLLTLFLMLTHRPRKLVLLLYACQKLLEAQSGR